MNYQLDYLSEIRNDARNVFQKRGIHFLIHLNIKSLQFKIDEICHIVKLTNNIIIGLSETKLDNTVLSSELKIESYDLVRFDLSQREGGVVCFLKNTISYNRKPNFYINAESIFIEIFLPKSKPVLIGISYRPPIIKTSEID